MQLVLETILFNTYIDKFTANVFASSKRNFYQEKKAFDMAPNSSQGVHMIK